LGKRRQRIVSVLRNVKVEEVALELTQRPAQMPRSGCGHPHSSPLKLSEAVTLLGCFVKVNTFFVTGIRPQGAVGPNRAYVSPEALHPKGELAYFLMIGLTFR